MLATYMYDATPEQIGQAYKCFEGSKPFYMVANSQDKTDENGKLIEYKVKARFDTEKKVWVFSCTCKSGEHNFKNVKHESKVCWHVRAALACAREEKKALAEMAAQVDAEKQAPTVETSENCASAQNSEDVTASEDVATEVVNQPVTSDVTTVQSVPADVVRNLRAKTANKAAQWNNSHQSTIPASKMPPMPPTPMSRLKSTLYSRPFSLT